ncbi:MAG: virulence factor [Gammaproteobacteria bacterium]|nr:virulence factor [Gammaproteobacteria bacterium]
MEKIIVYWRDIPSQVIVKKGRNKKKALLKQRFQEAIDRAAMRARKHDSDAYMSEWKRVRSLLEDADDLETIVRREAQRIEAAYSDDRLLQLIKNHGETPK